MARASLPPYTFKEHTNLTQLLTCGMRYVDKKNDAPTQRLVLFLTLPLLTLGQVTGADDFGLVGRSLVRREGFREEHAHSSLVLGVFGVLARRDGFCEPSRALKK